MDDYNEEQDFGIVRPFYLEASRPVDRLPTMGQQLADAWRAEHGDEGYPE